MSIRQTGNYFPIIILGIVCDNAPDNRNLWKTLGISFEDTENIISSFPHPITNQNVWIFADFPHLIKLLRNNLIDNGFTLQNGEKLNSSHLRQLIQLDKAELKICHKLTEKHLTCKNQERMRVAKAFELFSHTNAVAMKTFLPHKSNVANFIELINDSSDILNSRFPNSNANIYKTPYGQHYEKQTAKLKELYEAIRFLKIGKRKKLYPFQKGFLLTINSTIKLWSEMRENYPQFKFLLTARLNQDHLENFFSLIRGFGGFNQNPSPTETITRIKAIALSQNLKHSEYLSVKDEDFGTGTNSFNTFLLNIDSETENVQGT